MSNARQIEVMEPRGGEVTWADPGFFTRQSRTRNVLRVLKQLVIPPEGHKTIPTPSGIVLIMLSLGIGSAAYNTSSNILFMTLSLLLSSLLLSGILSLAQLQGNALAAGVGTAFPGRRADAHQNRTDQ